MSGVNELYPYWLILLYFTAGSLLVQDRSPSRGTPLFVMGLLAICLMIGLRFEVGGDWIEYAHIFNEAEYQQFSELARYGDVAYQALNWSVQKLNWPFWTVNLVTGMIFCWGLARFASSTPNQWTAVVVSIPYLVIVVAMGYTRQSAAIGVLLCGLDDFRRRGSLTRAAAYIFIAALFHKTAVICLPLFFFRAHGKTWLNIVLLAAFSVIFFQFFLADAIDGLKQNYIDSGYNSGGALIRIILISVPSLLFLSMKNKFQFSSGEQRIWTNYSFASLLMLFMFAISPSSTAVDRVGLYLLPVEVTILAAIPSISNDGLFAKASVIVFSVAVQFTWLNFGTTAAAWLPYRTYLSDTQ